MVFVSEALYRPCAVAVSRVSEHGLVLHLVPLDLFAYRVCHVWLFV